MSREGAAAWPQAHSELTAEVAQSLIYPAALCIWAQVLPGHWNPKEEVGVRGRVGELKCLVRGSGLRLWVQIPLCHH